MPAARPLKAVILAAGYATRLYPLTENKPKCLLTVGGRTILDALCEKLDALESLEEIILVTNARFFDQLNVWKKESRLKRPVRILNDGTTSNDNRLGAIGDLGLAIREAAIRSDILLLASDNLFKQNLNGFINFAQEKKDAVSIAVYDLRDPKLAAKKFGVVEMDASGFVTRLEEKPESPRVSTIGMGVYYFPAGSLHLVTDYLGLTDAQDAPGYYVRWLAERVKIFGFIFSGLWYDIGDLKSLEEANRLFSVL